MIIYGWNAKNIKQAPLENYECPQCHQKQSVLAIFAKYVHIFWIPVFPYKKTAVIVCTNCKKETDENAIASATGVNAAQLKSAVPTPKYLFTGLALIVAAVSYFTYLGMEAGKLQQSYIDAPQVGDVFVIKHADDTSTYNHVLFKIREIHGDSLSISYSSFGYNGIVSKLDPNDGFLNIAFTVHKDGLKKFDESGEIKKVYRGYGPSSGFDQEVEFAPDTLSVD